MDNVDDTELWQFDDTPSLHTSHGRESNCMNEDDYDYALELRPGMLHFLLWKMQCVFS